MNSVLIIGSTGLVGNFFLKHSTEFFQNVFTISRREPANSNNDKITTILSADSAKWAEEIEKLDGIDTLISSLGTTRAKAGGLANQYKIDHDLNLELAKVAKSKGVKNYILVSSLGASSDSMLPYLKMKGELENEVIALNFDKTVILRPGFLLGKREGSHGLANDVAVKLFGWSHNTMFARVTGSPVQAEEVAMAGLNTLAKCLNTDEKVVILDGLQVNKAAAAGTTAGAA